MTTVEWEPPQVARPEVAPPTLPIEHVEATQRVRVGGREIGVVAMMMHIVTGRYWLLFETHMPRTLPPVRFDSVDELQDHVEGCAAQGMYAPADKG